MILFLDFDGVTHPEPYAQESAFNQLARADALVMCSRMSTSD